ncbi:chaoptin-like [Sabethes cyaneus]|uniref:chaoptin-like n=1 Tax=Sabethes cyaneus TaxID=53552 RepID=UPI00237ED17F|nr:chaoptin-like [Sabethes cyaneus]
MGTFYLNVFLFYVFVALPHLATGWYYNCYLDANVLLQDGCNLKNIVVDKQIDAENIYFPPTNINFFNSNFSSFSPTLGRRLSDETEHVNFFNCLSPKVAIPLTLKRLGIFFNNLEKVFANYYEPNKLEQLSIVGTQITEIRFVEVLNQLQFLRIQKNLVRFVNFERFRNLSRLEIIDLRENRISSIEPGLGPITLPILRELHLNGNYLIELDSSLWSLPNLSLLKLDTNFLKSLNLPELESSMPLLSEITLGKNLWNCKRINEIVEYFAAHSISYVSGVDALGCYSFDYVEYLSLSLMDEVTLAGNKMIDLNETSSRYFEDAKSLVLDNLLNRNHKLENILLEINSGVDELRIKYNNLKKWIKNK